MGSGSSNTTTVQKQDPYKPAQPFINSALPHGRQLYRNGDFDPYVKPTSGIADRSGSTRDAYQMIAREAGAGTPMVDQARRSLGGIMSGNVPYADLMQNNPYLAQMGKSGDATLGALSKSDPRLAALAKGDATLGALSKSDPRLAALAKGDATLAALSKSDPRLAAMAKTDPRLAGLMASDPRLASMMSGTDIYRDLGKVKANALGSAVPAAVSMFSGNGMTDSSAAMDTVGRAATEAVAPIDYGAWSQAQDRRLAAVGQDDASRLAAFGLDNDTRLAAMGQDAATRGSAAAANAGLRMDAIGQDAATRGSAAQANAGLRMGAIGQDAATRGSAAQANAGLRMGAIGQNADTRLAAGGLRQSGQLSAAGMSPGLTAAGYLPGQMLGQVGAQKDQHAQAQLDDYIARMSTKQGGKASAYNNYIQSLMGLGGMGSSGSSTGPSGQPSTGAKIAGAGLGGLGTYGALAGMGLGGPLAIGGGALAALMGLI
jgi:hypothetical protein